MLSPVITHHKCTLSLPFVAVELNPCISEIAEMNVMWHNEAHFIVEYLHAVCGIVRCSPIKKKCVYSVLLTPNVMLVKSVYCNYCIL